MRWMREKPSFQMMWKIINPLLTVVDYLDKKACDVETHTPFLQCITCVGLMMSNEADKNSADTSKIENAKELGAYVAGGAAAGAGVSHVVGGMGLAVAGTGVGIGLGTVAVAGVVVGVAAYGVKKAFFDSNMSPTQQASSSENETTAVDEVMETTPTKTTIVTDEISDLAMRAKEKATESAEILMSKAVDAAHTAKDKASESTDIVVSKALDLATTAKEKTSDTVKNLKGKLSGVFGGKKT